MTLLEVIIASSMLAILLTSIGVLLRSSRIAWEAHSNDYIRIEAAHATLRHIVREIRRSVGVTAISAATDNSGEVTLRMDNGDSEAWSHDSGTDSVLYGVNVVSPTGLLADNVTGLRFTGYRADGLTITSTPAEVQCLLIDVTVTLPRETAVTRTVSSWAWVRSW